MKISINLLYCCRGVSINRKSINQSGVVELINFGRIDQQNVNQQKKSILFEVVKLVSIDQLLVNQSSLIVGINQSTWVSINQSARAFRLPLVESVTRIQSRSVTAVSSKSEVMENDVCRSRVRKQRRCLACRSQQLASRCQKKIENANSLVESSIVSAPNLGS
jgi:hypothetical protein